MKIKKLVLEKFKKVDRAELELDSVNVLVGGNNSGKSSVLQGIHFSFIAAVAQREAGQNTFTQDSLLYCPARGFEALRHGGGYLNQSNFGWLRLVADHPEEPNAAYNIRIYRGRNEGNVGCQRSGSSRIGNLLSASDHLFSIYVPGLAGVSQVEQYRSESVVRRGVASGDANLYLRNVILLIKEKAKLTLLGEAMPLPEARRHGKAMYKLVRGKMHARFGKVANVVTPSPFLQSHQLSQILAGA